MRLSSAQLRVLKYCAKKGGAVTMLELRHTILLEPRDVDEVPTLLASAYLTKSPSRPNDVLLITPAGRIAAYGR